MALNFDFFIVAFDICFWWVWLMRFCVTTGVTLLNKISDGSLTQISNNLDNFEFESPKNRTKRRKRAKVSASPKTSSYQDNFNEETTCQSTGETDSDDVMQFTN